jgi:hypothetical protein
VAPSGDSDGVAALGQGLTGCPEIGSTVSRIGTVNGAVCYLTAAIGAGSLGSQKQVSRFLILGREGLFHASSYSQSAYVPPDLGQVGFELGVGCVAGDQPGYMSWKHFDELTDIGYAYEVWLYSFGHTVFARGGKFQRALQTDIGIGYSVGLSTFFLPLVPGNFFGLSFSIEGSETFKGPIFVRPYNDACGADPTEENAMEYYERQVQDLVDASFDEVNLPLTEAMAQRLGPLLGSLGSPGRGGLAEGVPAASNADFYAEMLSHSGTTPNPDAPSTSVDGLVVDLQTRVAAAGDDTQAIVNAGYANQELLEQALPSRPGLSALTQDIGVAIQAAGELADLATSAKLENSYIGQGIVRVPTKSGELASVQLPAEEVAELIGRPVADVVDATVTVNAGGLIDNAMFTLSSEGLGLNVDSKNLDLLVRFDIDLSTAAGAFGDDVASWVVRPALRLVTVDAGPATDVLLSSPTRLPSGSPASLSVQVVDAAGKIIKRPFDVTYFDASGNELGRATSEYGTALLQYIPTPSTPMISEAILKDITVSDEVVRGVTITGTGFSAEAVLRVDGEDWVLGEDYGVKSSTQILAQLRESFGAGSHQVQVVNPEGIASNVLSL